MSARPWVLFIEGLPGSGKSTTAAQLSEALAAEGHEHRCYLENARDNPVGFVWTADGARPAVLATTPEGYPFEAWERLAETGAPHIFESRLLQNTALFAMLNGQPEAAWMTYPQRILSILGRTHRCALILLQPTCARQHLIDTLASRSTSHPTWGPFVGRLFTGLPWTAARGLEGEASFVTAMSAWSEVQRRMVEALDAPLCVVEDPARDWPTALAMIRAFVEARLLSV